MIISHRHKFIFLKTRKVGGTSLEIAMSKILGEDDIITPIVPKDEELRQSLGFRGPQHFELPLLEFGPSYAGSLLRGVKQWGLSPKAWPVKFWNHIPAADIKKRVDADVWNTYYKFSIERNPWDYAVSRYFWAKRNFNADLSFEEYVDSGDLKSLNFQIYALDGAPVTNRMVRYENLIDDLKLVGEDLGIGDVFAEGMTQIRAKGEHRKVDSYKTIHTEKTADFVAKEFSREIHHFGHAY